MRPGCESSSESCSKRLRKGAGGEEDQQQPEGRGEMEGAKNKEEGRGKMAL